jgi:hypothetical protein
MNDKRSPIAIYLEKVIDKSQKNQREIAREIGYEHANMISMFKTGEAKVPLHKLPLLAKALGVDPTHLLRLGLLQYGLADLVETWLGRAASENEEKLFLTRWRAATKNADPAPNPRLEVRVRQMIKEMLIDIQQNP